MNSVFQIEEVINQLFDEVCPPVGSEKRALKPLLASTLGQLMPDHDARRLVSDREYYRVDLADFADYATSTLPPPPILGDYPDNRALLFEGLERRPEDPLFTTNWSGRDFGLSILDAVLTRYKAFVSVTIRLLVYRDPRATYRQQYGDLDADDVAGATLLATMVFAAKSIPGITSLDDTLLAKQPLEEWDRYYVLLPVPSDLEWRFVLSGTYTDCFLDECLQNPGRPGGLTRDQVRLVREGKRENESTNAVEFELARLALALPHYVSFMYDLVEKETVQVRRTNHPPIKRAGIQVQPGDGGSLKYRVIRTVRVVRPDSGAKGPRRAWSPPSQAYAVCGHWRVLSDLNREGHGQYGEPVKGKTWVRDYQKGPVGAYPFLTSSERSSSSVVINIKEPLSYGRDVIQASGTTASHLDRERKQHPRESVANAARKAPSSQWRAQERAKLTAGLRFFILQRDGYRCRRCGRSAADENGVILEVDHIIPVDHWGRTEEANLWTLCRDCNRGKGAHPA